MKLGKVKRIDGRWHVDAEPHVMVRAKRLFSASLGRHGTVIISATEENSTDLLWFMERFPLKISPADLEHARALSASHAARLEANAKILRRRKATVKRDLEKPLREYQRVAVQWWQLNPRHLNADDLGVGKTIQAIGGVVQDGGHAACVVPNHIQRQWKQKFAEFAPWLNVHIARKGTKYNLPEFINGVEIRKGVRKTGDKCDVLILNYEKLVGWCAFIAEWAAQVVYDEAEELAREGSQKYDSALLISRNVPRLLGMTNTPIRNYGGEMYNVYRALGLEDFLGTKEEFRREWCHGYVEHGRPGKEPLLKNPEAFVAHLKANGLMLRRTSEECGLKTHKPEVIPFEIDCDAMSLRQLDRDAEALARVILGQTGASNFDKMQAANELDWKLRQATGIAKAPGVAELVRMLVHSGEKVLLSGWHREVYDIWNFRLREFNPVMYTGTESAARKEASKQAFINGDAQVMMISNRSGSGLDGLQHVCRIAVVGELDWSWSRLKQLFGRLARDGQQGRVLAYVAHTDEGADPAMLEVLGIKKDQLQGITDPDEKEEIKQIDPEHIKSLARDYLQRRGKLKPGPVEALGMKGAL